MEVEFLSFNALRKLVQDDTIEIKRVVHDTLSDGGFYVFYEEKMKVAQQERQKILELVEIAKEVSTEEDYAVLKNNRQREIYLSLFHLLTKGDAYDVIELLKHEMAVLFKEEDKEEQ